MRSSLYATSPIKRTRRSGAQIVSLLAAITNILDGEEEQITIRHLFYRLVVTPEQIQEHDLPTRPVKKTDTRAAGWLGGCVEVDTMKPAVLKTLVRECITQHIDRHQWQQTKVIEWEERETLRQFAAGIGGTRP